MTCLKGISGNEVMSSNQEECVLYPTPPTDSSFWAHRSLQHPKKLCKLFIFFPKALPCVFFIDFVFQRINEIKQKNT